MRLFSMKIAGIVSALALAIAHTSSMACLILIIGEPKMPESLYIKD